MEWEIMDGEGGPVRLNGREGMESVGPVGWNGRVWMEREEMQDYFYSELQNGLGICNIGN